MTFFPSDHAGIFDCSVMGGLILLVNGYAGPWRWSRRPSYWAYWDRLWLRIGLLIDSKRDCVLYLWSCSTFWLRHCWSYCSHVRNCSIVFSARMMLCQQSRHSASTLLGLTSIIWKCCHWRTWTKVWFVSVAVCPFHVQGAYGSQKIVEFKIKMFRVW